VTVYVAAGLLAVLLALAAQRQLVPASERLRAAGQRSARPVGASRSRTHAPAANRPAAAHGPVVEERPLGVARRPVWGVLAALALIAVGALRWRVGTDYVAYSGEYPDYVAMSWRDYDLVNEPGIRVLSRLAFYVRDDYTTMFALAAAVTIGLSVYTLYRDSNAFAFSVLLYVITGPWLGSFNGVRQYLACAIIFAGHRLVLERRFGRWLLVVLVAGLFHISAYLMILLYFVPRRRLSPISAIVLISLAGFATEIYGRVLDLIVVFREDQDFGGRASYFFEDVNPLRIAAALAPLVFYVLFTDKTKLSPNDHFYVHILLLHGAILLASSGSAYIARFAVYTGVFLCLAIPRLVTSKDPRTRAFMVLMIVMFYGIFWYVETAGIRELANFRSVFDRPAAQ
jgi:transmembrane protein EpsG